jgi:signal peptidase I
VAREIGIVVGAALVLSFLLKTFLIQSFSIPSRSMEPLLEEGDRVIVTKLAPRLLDLHRGDVVVFKDPGDWVQEHVKVRQSAGPLGVFRVALREIGLLPADGTEYLIKRVIGLPGDRVSCEGTGQPIKVNGVALDETYLPPGMDASAIVFDVVVPGGTLWLMGDDRVISSDSRAHMSEIYGGAVAMRDVVGVAHLRSWPINRWSTISNPGEVFAEVPEPNQGPAS